jgi:hypothetical protein
VAGLLSLVLCAILACDRTESRVSAETQTTLAATGTGGGDTACGDIAARPATGAPAEGVWRYDAGEHRVAAIVGPAQAVAGQAHVTRRVETVEARREADTLRFVSDTATVRLEFLAPSARPAAVYAVGALVRLASYEPCGPMPLEPLIRYLRQDPEGHVATDVMLRRDASAP